MWECLFKQLLKINLEQSYEKCIKRINLIMNEWNIDYKREENTSKNRKQKNRKCNRKIKNKKLII